MNSTIVRVSGVAYVLLATPRETHSFVMLKKKRHTVASTVVSHARPISTGTGTRRLFYVRLSQERSIITSQINGGVPTVVSAPSS